MPQPHKVLVIGVGSVGERHLRCFQATGRAEVSLVEINEGIRRKVADRYGVQAAYPSLDAGLEDRHDAAVIATPAPLHVSLATRLAERGVHVLIEKPLGTSLDGVERLQRTVRERQVVAMVAYVYRVHPALAAMKKALDEGRFGKPLEIVAVCGQHFPTYRPAYRTTYYADRAQGGGAIQDALTHVINAGEWLVGPVDRLVADTAHQVLEGVEVEDTVHVLTRHGRAMGCYCLNQHQAPNEITITIVCDGGTTRWEFHRDRWRWMTRPEEDWHDEPRALLERDSLFTAQANAFLDVIEARALPLCSLEEGIQTLRVNLAALASAEDGAWQAIQNSPQSTQRAQRNNR